MGIFNTVSPGMALEVTPVKDMTFDQKLSWLDLFVSKLSVGQLVLDEEPDDADEAQSDFESKLDELQNALEAFNSACDAEFGCACALDDLRSAIFQLSVCPLDDYASSQLDKADEILGTMSDTAQEMDDRYEATDIFNRLVMDMCDEGETKSGFIYDRYHVYISPDDADAFRDDSDWLATLVTAPKADFYDMYETAQRALDGRSMRQEWFDLLNDYLGGVIQFD